MQSDKFQRAGSISNVHVGREFEEAGRVFFENEGISLTRNISVSIGVSTTKGIHIFDLGSEEPPALVECKSHTWTRGKNIPSAKITVWNEAMYYFYLAPSRYRKILFVLRDYSDKRQETLGAYYIRTKIHLIPDGVEFWEYDPSMNWAERIL